MAKFQMPVLKGEENGEIMLTEARGWKLVYGNPQISTVWVFHHETGEELTLICPRLEPGEEIAVILAIPAQQMFYHCVSIADHVGDSNEGSSEMADVFTSSLNVGMGIMQEAYDENYENEDYVAG